MALGELKFNGVNGHSRILKMPGGEEITVPLMWEDLKIVTIPKGERIKGETEEEYHRWVIESNKPKAAMFFSRSDDYRGLYLGVQYYCMGYSSENRDQRIPIGSPRMLGDAGYDAEKIIKRIQPKDAAGHTLEKHCGIVVVQFYKTREN